jgi:mono/diheme cytochrome c family protein
LFLLLYLFLTPLLPAESPRVPAYQRLHQQGQQPVEAGNLLLGELNCTSCHQVSDAWMKRLPVKTAPILDDVGSRVRPQFVRALLKDPQAAKPGTTMPDVLAGLPGRQRDEAIEQITHFLASTGTIHDIPAPANLVVQGERLYHEIGCTACHDPRREGSEPLPTSISLPTMSAKYSVTALAQFLKDPLAIRPAGRMPHLNLNDQEARQISSYLLRDLQLPANTRFAYFEGNWQDLPDFSTLEAIQKGEGHGFDLSVARRRDQFGLQFDGTIVIPKDGTYRFHLGSDDGSRLEIDGETVVLVGGIHPLQFKSAERELKQGEHAVRVEYFEQGGEEVLRVELEGNGLKRQPLEGLLKMPRRDPLPGETPFELDMELALKGEQLFSQLGCASCHQLKRDGKQLAAASRAPDLAAVNGMAGCLAKETGVAPDFHLSARQRADLQAALGPIAAGEPGELSAAGQILATMTRFNCYACHERDGVGGVETARNALFMTNQKEMGDEARIPPLLTGVGSKLRQDWMEHVFNNGARDRPYMFTRMPRFQKQNIGPLAELFAASDKLEPLPAVEERFSGRQMKAAGRRLVGAKGYSCIKCHTYGSHKATGVQSISMTTMFKRLEPEWFRQYVVDPVRFRPGTRMPTAWPERQVLLPNVLDGTVDQQVHAVWTYLADGDKGAVPLGLGANVIELAATDNAIIYRNFIEGAGSRGIGVGYPEKANLAFDANQVSLAMLWHGAFMDASKHWNGRGQGYQPPLGDNVLRLEARPILAVLEDASQAWPREAPRESGYRFRGYRLEDKLKPVFLYQYQDIRVEDFFDPTSDKDFTPIKRTVRLSSEKQVEGLWFRVVAANALELKGHTLQVDNDWQLTVSGDVGARVVRKDGNRTEVIVPVTWRKTATGTYRAEIIQLFEW